MLRLMAALAVPGGPWAFLGPGLLLLAVLALQQPSQCTVLMHWEQVLRE